MQDPVNWIDPEGLVRGRTTVEQHFRQNILRGNFEEASLSAPYIERKFVEQCVKARGDSILKGLKQVGKGAGSRSGQHGTPLKQAGSQLRTEGNKIKGELGQVFKDVGNRMIEKGKGINHY